MRGWKHPRIFVVLPLSHHQRLAMRIKFGRVGLLWLCSILGSMSQQPEETPKTQTKPALVWTIKPEELKDFHDYPEEIKPLIRRALELTEKNLTYLFGSSDPQKGGMDCSGTLFHLLQSIGIKGAPRQSDEMSEWISKESRLHLTSNASSFSDPKFAELKPGHLLFWTGTYDTPSRTSRVSHVMLYLGKRLKDGAPLIFGASDGRTYEGQKRCGVSVFDFKIPNKKSKPALLGYGAIPGIENQAVKSEATE